MNLSAKKSVLMTVDSIRKYGEDLLHLVLKSMPGELPEIFPGQFVEVCIENSKTFLNRPISVFSSEGDTLELLVREVGEGTRALASYVAGDTIRIIGPLGCAWNMESKSPLLIGGGVGVAPMYALSKAYVQKGIRPTLIFGNRTAAPKELIEIISKYADVCLCTDDGTQGFHGLVTEHPEFDKDADIVQVCGPTPMMRAVVAKTRSKNINTEVSLENKMACGLGACLCCVEKTTTGHRCVCTDGPVFNSTELPW